MLDSCLDSEPSLDQWRTGGFVTFLSRLRTRGGICGPCTKLAPYILAFGLQIKKITKNFGQLKSRFSTNKRRTRFVSCTWPNPEMTSTRLLVPAALGFLVRRRSQPLVSGNIWQFAVLGVSKPQLTLNQTSKSGI